MNKNLTKQDLFCYVAILRCVEKLQDYKKSYKRLSEKRINEISRLFKSISGISNQWDDVYYLCYKGSAKEKFIPYYNKVAYRFNTGDSAYVKVIFPFDFEKFIELHKLIQTRVKV